LFPWQKFHDIQIRTDYDNVLQLYQLAWCTGGTVYVFRKKKDRVPSLRTNELQTDKFLAVPLLFPAWFLFFHLATCATQRESIPLKGESQAGLWKLKKRRVKRQSTFLQGIDNSKF
jgi:hypothetical protein